MKTVAEIAIALFVVFLFAVAFGAGWYSAGVLFQ